MLLSLLSFNKRSFTDLFHFKVGLVCHIEELLKSFTISLDRQVREEMDLFNQVSDEEWETIRPSRLDRRSSLLAHIKVCFCKSVAGYQGVVYNDFSLFQTELAEAGKCDKCISWTMKAGETWGKEYQTNSNKEDSRLEELLDVGVWHPREGHVMKDILFPHVFHGFRGRSLPLITFNVSFYSVGNRTKI